MSKVNKSKTGKHVCKVGYLEIRQKLGFKKPTEVYVVHKKNAVAGPFKDIKDAIEDAKRCINEGIRFSKHK